MNIENQVVSLELSKKLKSLNVPQKSLFYWFEDAKFTSGYPAVIYKYSQHPFVFPNSDSFSAYTVAELCEFLKVRIKEKLEVKINVIDYFVILAQNNGYLVDTLEASFGGDSDNLANTLARMLVHLLENNLLTFKTNEEKLKELGIE